MKRATASSPTNLSTIPSQRSTIRAAVPQKRVKSCPNSLGGNCSASPVDPRMSANIAEISTSAPPGCLCADLMHHVQSLRFSGEGLPPNTRMRKLPGLPNGA
jgi:hypothetical protein